MRKEELSMKEAKENLKKLDLLLPEETNALVSPFGEFLTEYLAINLTPGGFLKACQRAISDLKAGTKSHSGQKIEGILAGHPKIIYSILGMSIPEIVDVIFPVDFAKKVKELRSEMKEID
jgi:hypothetical protein